MPSLPLAFPLDLSATLMGGQTFCWSENPVGVFSGWIGQIPLQIHVQDGHLCWNNPAMSHLWMERYFCLDLDVPAILGKGATDPWLTRASQAHPGLRPVREDPWECLVNFLCSSLKQIVQIRQINTRIRSTLGDTSDSFPSPGALARAGEKALRNCSLGYRARHVERTAQIVADNPEFLTIPSSLSTSAAAQHLEQLPGVGPKISRCVLLYAYSRWDAFPVDVWVDRLIRSLYFPRRRKAFRFEELERWSQRQFGMGRGLAQLWLFHWFRNLPNPRSSHLTKRLCLHLPTNDEPREVVPSRQR